MGNMPEKIGKYEIRSVLGEGGIGIVYEGFDPGIERRVAIKILQPHLIRGKVGEDLLARFKREAVSAARCQHPNIVTILEYGQHGKMPFIAMEYVNGIPVKKLIKHKFQISLKRIVYIVSQLLRALNAAHRLDVVHRDVKASNVMILKGSGRVKLADFGMARLAENSDLTVIGHFVGTPRYMAPELRLGFEADARADIFSSTRLFLELLQLMADDQVPRSHLPKIAGMPPGNRIDYSELYPTSLIPVLSRGLAVEPDDRYQSVRDFMLGIKQALPNLYRNTAIYAQAAARVPAAAAVDPVSEDELDSITNLLIDYMGPIATVLMEEHETESTTAINLANELAKEIPEPEKQEEFLRRWERMSQDRREARERKEPVVSLERVEPRPKHGEVMDRMGVDFAHYVGPIAEPLLQHYSSITKDINQLVKFLGGEIPDPKQSRKFIKSWTRE